MEQILIQPTFITLTKVKIKTYDTYEYIYLTFQHKIVCKCKPILNVLTFNISIFKVLMFNVSMLCIVVL
jgi:hypothetical protein